MKCYDENIEQLLNLIEDAVWEGEYKYANGLFLSGFLDEPGYAKLHYYKAWMHHFHQIDKGLAERHYKLAIHFDDTYRLAYERLGDLYLETKQYAALKALMNKVKKVDILEKDYVFETLGKVAEIEGIYGQAMQNYRFALMHCIDNDTVSELKKNIKRIRFKRIKKSLKWLQIN